MDGKKKLDGIYTRMLWAILNKSWRQHPTKQQLYSHLPPIMKTIKVRQTRHAGHCYGPPHMSKQKQGDQLKPTYSSSVRIWDVALRTCQNNREEWQERSGTIRWWINLNESCQLHPYFLQRTWSLPGPCLPKMIRNMDSRNYYNLKGKDIDI